MTEAASARARLAFDSGELAYDFGSRHPLQPVRLVAMLDLLEKSALWQSSAPETSLPLRPATLAELALAHTPAYLDVVQRLSKLTPSRESQEARSQLLQEALRYGFAEGDTPVLPGMHDICSLIVGGTLVSLSAVMGLPEGGVFENESERPLHVFHPGGGLHHAWADRASGFCVYNDISVAIAHILRSSEAKVLYVDFDAHHGDGVQRSFYDEPRVMTVSFHETGRYLFPGTGDVLELGRGLGRGYSINVPLEPFTEDDSYIETLESLLSPLVLSFAPDVIISQHGCDTHAWDPLTHLALTTRSMQAQARLIHQLAHTYCQGRWVAVGGGGYDLYRVVPRAWTLLWAEMCSLSLPERLPETWLARWLPAWQKVAQQEAEAQQAMGKDNTMLDFPTRFEDLPDDFPAQARRDLISRVNRHTAGLLRHMVIPSSVRQAFPRRRAASPLSGLVDRLRVRRSATPSRSITLETAKGSVLLRDFCPPSLVERLQADDGLRAFARLPERERQLLLTIARRPDCALALAHTPTGQIVGEVTLAPGDEWWDGLENVYEVAIEVSSNWRGVGLAHALLAFALELDELEDMILFAVGLSWHWDTEGLGISVYRYRELIVRLFASQGFVEYPTTEPNVSMEPANVFLARVGKRVDAQVVGRFFNHLLSRPNLTGL